MIVGDSSDGSSLFVIDKSTGLISTAGTYDRETVTHYVLNIAAKDTFISPNTKSVTATMTVSMSDANEFDPHFASAVTYATVDEDAGIDTRYCK